MDFIYIHSKKSQVTVIVEEFVNLINTRYDARIRYFRTDRETSLGSKFKELTAAKDIIIERSALAILV
jgi:hypothetical protein